MAKERKKKTNRSKTASSQIMLHFLAVWITRLLFTKQELFSRTYSASGTVLLMSKKKHHYVQLESIMYYRLRE